MNAKEKLVEELKNKYDWIYTHNAESFADFIEADRARIVKPLVKYLKSINRDYVSSSMINTIKAIDEAIKLSGV